jgi:hypothetical protein
MSKKSRRRNKKILAVLGALGGAALMAKNKRNAGITDNAAKENFAPVIESLPKKKPVITMPDNLSKNMGKDNEQLKPRFTQVINKKGDIQTLRPFKNAGLTFKPSDRKVDRTANAVAKANKDMSLGKLPPQLQNPGRTNITTAQGENRKGLKDITNFIFPKLNLKSGGRVKGCGKALRGFGRAMKKGKK